MKTIGGISWFAVGGLIGAAFVYFLNKTNGILISVNSAAAGLQQSQQNIQSQIDSAKKALIGSQMDKAMGL